MVVAQMTSISDQLFHAESVLACVSMSEHLICKLVACLLFLYFCCKVLKIFNVDQILLVDSQHNVSHPTMHL